MGYGVAEMLYWFYYYIFRVYLIISHCYAFCITFFALYREAASFLAVTRVVFCNDPSLRG